MRRWTKGALHLGLAAAALGATTLSPVSAAAQAPAARPPALSPEGEVALAQYPDCTRQPTEADVEGAKGAHRAATQFFERGDYERAIQYWRDAYGFDCSRPPLLLNIANAHEKRGEKAAAVGVLELFLARAADSPDGPTVREKVENLRAALEAEKSTVVSPPPPPPRPPEAPAAEPRVERPFGVAPWIVTGAGGAIALVGLVPLIIGEGKISDAEKACPFRSSCAAEVADQGNTGRTLSLVGQVLVPVGLVTAAGGLVWQLGFNAERPVEGAKAPRPSSVRAEIVPVLSGDVRGAVVSGSF